MYLPVFRTCQTRLAVRVGDGGEVTADEFEISAELDVIGRHLEHAQVEVGDGRKRSTSYQKQRSLLWIVQLPLQAVFGECVVLRRWWGDVGGPLVGVIIHVRHDS